MLPGKSYKPEDILHILKRRIWYVLVPFAIVSAGTAVYVRTLPNLYRAEALLMISPQRVSEAYVRSTVTSGMEERLLAIQQQILSRTQLERMINEFQLYQDLRQAGIMQDIVERMQRDIRVQPVQGESFRVSYVGHNPAKVKQVTDELARLFVNESLLDRANQAETTNVFLESELSSTLARLEEQEQKLAAYRRAHTGELPEQLQSNLQGAQNTQMQIQGLLEAYSNNLERRIVLERRQADLEGQVTAPEAAPVVATGDAVTLTTAQQLAQQRALLASLEQRYTPEHPDIVGTKRRIADLEKQAEREALSAPLSGPGAGLSPAEAARQKALAEVRIELALLNRQIASQQEDEKRLRGIALEYQRRAEAAPTRQTELIQLTRDYATLNDVYSKMLANRESARIATNLETRQHGESFRILDPARTPELPFYPNRERLVQMGMAAGLVIGVALVGLLEYRDGSLKTDDDVKAIVGVPVLAVVPLMRSDGEKRRAKARRLAVHLGFGTVVAGCFAVLAYTLIR